MNGRTDMGPDPPAPGAKDVIAVKVKGAGTVAALDVDAVMGR